MFYQVDIWLDCQTKTDICDVELGLSQIFVAISKLNIKRFEFRHSKTNWKKMDSNKVCNCSAILSGIFEKYGPYEVFEII